MTSVTLIEAAREHQLDGRGLAELLDILDESGDADAAAVALKIRTATWEAGATAQVVLSRDERLRLCWALEAADETTPTLRILAARLCWTTFGVGGQRLRVPRGASDRLAAWLHDDPHLSDVAAAIERATAIVTIDRRVRAPLLARIRARGAAGDDLTDLNALIRQLAD